MAKRTDTATQLAIINDLLDERALDVRGIDVLRAGRRAGKVKVGIKVSIARVNERG